MKDRIRLKNSPHVITSLGLCIAIILLGLKSNAQTIDSLDIKIGQMILVGTTKAEVDTAVLKVVREGKVGGIILFEKNIPNKPEAFIDFKKIIWAYQKQAPFPLFISIDQEGGQVNRLKEKYGFPRSISAAVIGQSKAIDSARFYAETTAATLAGLGINVNFAPCVDLAINPSNPVIVSKGRSYSLHEDSVVMMAREVIVQHRKLGIVTVLKHFPGHGSSTNDSHFGVADVTKTWSNKEIKPYQLLFKEGYVDAIMSCHIVNKKLDSSGKPGTLSSDMLEGMLRKKIGFDGVVFSDDMQMEAISKQYGFEESIKMAILAGVDVLCFANNVPNAQKKRADDIFNVIKQAVTKGEITAKRIDESYQRIKKIKTEFNFLKLGNDEIQKARFFRKHVQEQLKIAQEEIKALQTKLEETKHKKRKKRKKEKKEDN